LSETNARESDRTVEERCRAAERRELAEKILLKLIEVSPAATMANEEGEGIRLAWQIADAFLKAENS
jgi:hypothetical protein